MLLAKKDLLFPPKFVKINTGCIKITPKKSLKPATEPWSNIPYTV